MQKVSSKKTVGNEIEYKVRRIIAKRQIIKYIANPKDTISHLESDIYRIKPKIFKILKHIDNYIKNQQL